MKSSCPRLADLSLGIVEDLLGTLEQHADVGTGGMLGPAADLSQLDTHLSEVHLDVLQPARRSVRTAEVAPELLALLRGVISDDRPPLLVPRQPSLPRRTYLRPCRAPPQAKDALRCSHQHVLLTASRGSQRPIGPMGGRRCTTYVPVSRTSRCRATRSLELVAGARWSFSDGRQAR